MKKHVTSALSTLALIAAPTLAMAEKFPDHAITIIVPYAAGGSNDLVARVLSQSLSQNLGVSVVVDNAAGASGTIGAAKAVRAKPDGYTMLMGSNSEISIAALTNSAVKYDGQRDLVPVRMVGSQPMVLVTNPQSGIRNADDLLASSKSGKRLSYGTSGVGTPLHLAGELISSSGQLNMNHVPYKGGALAINDLVGGQIDTSMLVLSTGLPFIKSGKLVPIGVTSAERSQAAPDIPALAENKALSAVNMRLWFGMFVPKGTPKAAIKRLSDAIAQALADPAVKKKLTESGVDIDAKTGPQFAKFIASETDNYRKIVDRAGIGK